MDDKFLTKEKEDEKGTFTRKSNVEENEDATKIKKKPQLCSSTKRVANVILPDLE